MNDQRQALFLQNQEVAAAIKKIESVKAQLADQIEPDRDLRDRYAKDAEFYAKAEQ